MGDGAQSTEEVGGEVRGERADDSAPRETTHWFKTGSREAVHYKHTLQTATHTMDHNIIAIHNRFFHMVNISIPSKKTDIHISMKITFLLQNFFSLYYGEWSN